MESSRESGAYDSKRSGERPLLKLYQKLLVKGEVQGLKGEVLKHIVY